MVEYDIPVCIYTKPTKVFKNNAKCTCTNCARGIRGVFPQNSYRITHWQCVRMDYGLSIFYGMDIDLGC